MLIITNGDSAVTAIKKTKLSAEFLPWRDVLYECPVPESVTPEELSKIRSEFLVELGCGAREIFKSFQSRDKSLNEFGSHDEIILWFEHDLYDQLQLIQILDWFFDKNLSLNKLFMICWDEYVSESSPDVLSFHFNQRKEVTKDTLNPLLLQEYVGFEKEELPYINNALIRFLEEYPNIRNGLSRCEEQILKIVDSGTVFLKDLFPEFQKPEDPKYLGDYSFFQYIKSLVYCDKPLLNFEGNKSFEFLPIFEKNDTHQKLLLTKNGKKC